MGSRSPSKGAILGLSGPLKKLGESLPKVPYIRQGRDPHMKGQIWGLSGPLKNTGVSSVVYAVKGIVQSPIMACNKKDSSMLASGRCHITLYVVKNLFSC